MVITSIEIYVNDAEQNITVLLKFYIKEIKSCPNCIYGNNCIITKSNVIYMSILDIRVNSTETIPVFIYLFWPQQSWCHLPSEPTPSTSPGKQKQKYFF